ncbi:hypothetical protein [Sphingomonas sp. GM_Shp_1]|uniref:hypothetical protein n=1 Tax=Sphingomonas sp. GM_Shp_1 TaxID=2937381 RepID=UPI00226B62AD|nr:hypothetical protein [Sphingomonas sp. GM_Shp_1]
MRKTLIGLSLATLLTATAAQAQTSAPPPPPPGRMGGAMMGMQPDASGNITRAAAIAAADQRFAAMDANHDGTVTPDEMRAYREQRRTEWQQRRQGGGDRPGRRAPQPITADAFRARAVAMFDRLDTNHDGKIDAAERAAAPRFSGRRHGGMAPGAQPAPQQDD